MIQSPGLIRIIILIHLPLDIYITGILFSYSKLQWWTYIELIAIGLFILLGFSGFTFIRNNEKNTFG